MLNEAEGEFSKVIFLSTYGVKITVSQAGITSTVRGIDKVNVLGRDAAQMINRYDIPLYENECTSRGSSGLVAT